MPRPARCLASLLPLALLAATPTGVVIEGVAPHSTAERAGLRPGDAILSWARPPAPPANPQGAQGSIESPLDLVDVETEQAPRGPITFAGRRGQEEMTWTLPAGVFGLSARPPLDADLLALYREGQELLQAKKARAAAVPWRTAAEAAQARGDRLVGIWFLVSAATGLFQARIWPEAEAAAEQAIADAEAIGQLSVAAQELEDWAAWRVTSDPSRAWECVRRALALDQKLGPEGLRTALLLRGLAVADQLREDRGAEEEHERAALTIRERLAPGSLEVADSLTALGNIMRDRDEFASAEDYYRRAMVIQEKLAPGDLVLAGSYNDLGMLASRRSDWATAEGWHRRALAIQETRAPRTFKLIGSLASLADVARSRGDLATAEDFSRQSLAILEETVPGTHVVAEILDHLGMLASLRGDLTTAEDYYQRALAIQETLRPSVDVADTSDLLGSLARRRGDLARAEHYHQRALAIREKLAPGRLGKADTLHCLGEVAEARDDLKMAEEYYRRALQVREELAPGGLDLGHSFLSLGNLASKRRDWTAAEGDYRRALASFEKLSPGTTAEAEARHQLGLLYRHTGRVEKASALFLSALDSLESQRAKLGSTEEVRSGYAAAYTAYYHDAMEALIALGRPADALHVLERSRARSLLALLAERDVLFSADLPPELARERRQTDAEYDGLQARIAGLHPVRDQPEIGKLLARLGALREAQEVMAARVRQASPHFASVHYPEPLRLQGIREVVDPGTVLLAYDVGVHETMLFVVQSADRPAPGLRVFSLPIGEPELRRRVERFRGDVQRPVPSKRAALTAQAAALYDLLLRPAEAEIEGSRRVLLSPDGPLRSLPFAALVRRDRKNPRAARYLVEWKPLHVVTSATLYGELKRSRRERGSSPGSLAAFGDPRYPALPSGPLAASTDPGLREIARGFALVALPYTRQEVDGIARLFPDGAQTYVGTRATEERVKSLGPDVRYLHFACHAYLDERFPLNSGLALTIPERPAEGQDNGLLQAWEIFDKLRLEADLVTLSACNTALGKEMGGEGLLGLTRAFHYAGARSVLATLWGVSDSSTPRLMERLYTRVRAGRSLDEALQEAQIDFIRGRVSAKGGTAPDLSHPFRWAAYQLSGDWR